MKQKNPSTVPCKFEIRDSAGGWSAEFFAGKRRLRAVAVKRDGSTSPELLAEEQEKFIAKIQDLALQYAGNAGLVLAPENFVSDYWTRDFILRLADSLRRPRRRKGQPEALELYLRAAWIDRGLCNMDRYELATHLNSFLSLKITPAAAWQMAYRLDLFSKRTSGPKPKKQAAGKL